MSVQAWQRILSEGHTIVARINSSRAWFGLLLDRQWVVRTAIVAVLVVLVSYAANHYLAPRYERGIASLAAGQDIQSGTDPVPIFDLTGLLEAATANKESATIPAEKITDAVVKATIASIAAGKTDELNGIALTAVNTPWPNDGLVYKKLSEDVIFLGSKVRERQGFFSVVDGVWMALARKQNGEWVMYTLNPMAPRSQVRAIRLNSYPVVEPSSIPRTMAMLTK